VPIGIDFSAESSVSELIDSPRKRHKQATHKDRHSPSHWQRCGLHSRHNIVPIESRLILPEEK
jgi:hypothetical protein